MKKAFAVCLVALCMTIPTMAKQKTIRIKVIETSDVHGSFFPYDFITRQPKAGTMARVSHYVKLAREEYGENLILLDNGDILQGQPTCYYSNFIDTDHTNIAAEVINYLKYDAQTIGNHDIEPGHDVYDKWIREVKCPMLGANVIDTKTGKPYLQPYAIFKREGIKIAVIGLLTPAIPNWLSTNIWSGMRFEEMVSSAKYWMKQVQETEHPDIVIGLFHSGKDGGISTPEYDEDASIKVAKEVPGFDIVLFGHDHTRFHDIITNNAGQEVVCLDPANNALSIVDVSIELKMKGKKVADKYITGGIINVDDQPIDEAYMQHFQPRIDEVNNFVNRKIGEFKSSIYTRDSYFGSSAFNDLILNLELQITNADIAFNAPLSFNASIKEGPITMSDMFNLYRYENQLYVMRLTGEEISKHL